MQLKSSFFRVRAYIQYQLRARGRHHLHSPFLYNFYENVIQPSKTHRISAIEKLKKQLKNDRSLIEVIDYKTGKSGLKSIQSIAKKSLSTSQFSAFLSLLIKFINAESSLETGTSLGINALYMADTSKKLTTIERSSLMASLSKRNFSLMNAENIRLVNEDFYQVLEQEIIHSKPSLSFFDADHRSSSLAFCIDLILKHTPNAKCIVIHDIYWSENMKSMWSSLIQDPRFPLTIDIFQAGLLFLNLNMEKQHFTLRF